ncbi:hypothetical protein [Streptomyces monomycini]|uniref:hypothetical protein n=1 Tax=Streptomyces monomycini TaxID=371720 RepID=UPI0004AA3970|nr:hypothetical protein [Streptomyces monomycini]
MGREVRHLLVGDRRIDGCGRRTLVIAWRSARAGLRTLVVALGRNGAELSRLGLEDVLDPHTWALLREEPQEDGYPGDHPSRNSSRAMTVRWTSVAPS